MFFMEFLRLLEGIRTPFFNVIFQYVTMFGEETLFMVVAMIFFWCIDKKSGYFLLYVSFLGATVNQFLKLIFCVPRPWVLDPDFTIVESARAEATGYSFPSGHTQSAAGLFFGVARFRKEAWVRIVCVVIALLAGFSRMYLGVHTPADVFTSFGVALLLVLGTYPLFTLAWKNGRWFYLLIGVLLGVGLALIAYVEFVPLPANAIAEFSASGVKGAYTMFGASAGLTVVLLLETKYIRFSEKAVWWAQILKTAVGLGLVVLVRMLLKAPLLALFNGHNAANAVRYFLMVVLGGAVWPLTFKFWGGLGKKKEPAKAA